MKTKIILRNNDSQNHPVHGRIHCWSRQNSSRQNKLKWKINSLYTVDSALQLVFLKKKKKTHRRNNHWKLEGAALSNSTLTHEVVVQFYKTTSDTVNVCCWCCTAVISTAQRLIHTHPCSPVCSLQVYAQREHKWISDFNKGQCWLLLCGTKSTESTKNGLESILPKYKT